MSIIDRFVGFLKGKNKDKENNINNPGKENKIKDFINSINQPQPLIENLEEKILGLNPIQNAFTIIERIVIDKSNEDKNYALKKAESILNTSWESMDYFSKNNEIYIILNNIDLKKEKTILSFLNYAEANSNEYNAMHHLKLIGAIFRWAKNSQLKDDIKKALDNALLKIICNTKILTEYKKEYDFLGGLSFYFKEGNYSSRNIVRDEAISGFSREEKINYINKEIKAGMKTKSEFLWNGFPILKENLPLYKEYISFFFENREKDKEKIKSYHFQCEHKEIAELLLSEQYDVSDILDGIQRSFVKNDFVSKKELFMTLKETANYLNAYMSENERKKLPSLLRFLTSEQENLSRDSQSEVLIGYMEVISQFAKHIPFDDDFLKIFRKDFIPLIQKEEFTELKNIVDNVMNNAEINDSLKNELIKNMYVQKDSYFNMAPEHLKNALESYNLCSKYPAFNKVGFFENMFHIDLLRNGYRIYEHEKAEMILDLLKTQEVNIQKQIIFGMIKYNSMYKGNETEDLSIIGSYNQLKNTLKKLMKENNTLFKTSDIILNDSFNSDNLTINNILDLQEFEFEMDKNGSLEQLKENEEYLNLFEKSPIEAYSYARVFAEKEMLSSLIIENSTEEEIIPKRRRI